MISSFLLLPQKCQSCFRIGKLIKLTLDYSTHYFNDCHDSPVNWKYYGWKLQIWLCHEILKDSYFTSLAVQYYLTNMWNYVGGKVENVKETDFFFSLVVSFGKIWYGTIYFWLLLGIWKPESSEPRWSKAFLSCYFELDAKPHEALCLHRGKGISRSMLWTEVTVRWNWQWPLWREMLRPKNLQ